jgi:hypothetical protein
MEKREGWIQPGSINITVTVYNYVWDEFQVTTAEKVGNKYFMHANRFRYYHKGAPKTPLKRWYLSQRFRSSEILEKNIGK